MRFTILQQFDPFEFTIEKESKLTEYQAEYLTALQFQQEQRILYTYLDQYFDYDWGKMTRCLKDKGYFTIIKGRIKDKSEEDRVAGFLSVQIGKRMFNCLRILGLDQDLLHPEVPITEKYIDESDRTIMVRLLSSSRTKSLIRSFSNSEKSLSCTAILNEPIGFSTILTHS